MLYCTIDEVNPGDIVAASVLHPKRDDVELLSRGFQLDGRTVSRLKQLGITRLWVDHDAAADLDRVIDPAIGGSRRRLCTAMGEAFNQAAASSLSADGAVELRRVVMELICEVAANRKLAALSQQMLGSGGDLFTHGSGVAYLAIVLGTELESYIVQERSRLNAARACDLTGLGVGALLHDVGKLPDPSPRHDPASPARQDAARGAAGRTPTAAAAKQTHVTEVPVDRWAGGDADDSRVADYLEHPARGFARLKGSRVAASATQIILSHHRLFDGRGFPDLGADARTPGEGNPAGRSLHVFSRIAAVANVLDGLLRRFPHRPAINALSALRSSAFAGWFDPVVLDTALRRLPPFAMGSRVVLSDGEPAVVIAPSMLQPCRPTVRLLGESKRNADGSYPTIDLREKRQLHIAETEGADVSGLLFEMPEEPPASVRVGRHPQYHAA